MKERFYVWLAWKLPRSLVKWCAVRLITEGTTGKYRNTHVCDLRVDEAMIRWIENRNG